MKTSKNDSANDHDSNIDIDGDCTTENAVPNKKMCRARGALDSSPIVDRTNSLLASSTKTSKEFHRATLFYVNQTVTVHTDLFCMRGQIFLLVGSMNKNILRPMQTDTTSHNIVACCWVFVANNVASVCMDLKV